MRAGVRHVIMAGGSGTRFWPLSRASLPKQFLTLVGGTPLIRQAYERAAAMSGEESVYVAAGAAHRDLILDVVPGLPAGRLIVEPCSRNTAPCVGLAALRLQRDDPESVMVVSPADHVYTRPRALEEALAQAVTAARGGDWLVTLGIRPSRPETGYGYIETGAPAAGLPGGVRHVARFVEKPDLENARRYVASGHLWNSGVFVWRTRTILAAIETHAPDVWSGLRAIESAGGPDDPASVGRYFPSMPSVSVDYAVMERARDVLVVPCDPGWSDVGSWDAAADLHGADAAGNAFAPDADDILAIGASDCFVHNASGRTIALVGTTDLIVVDTGDALLVCRRGDSQSVRAVVEALKARGRTDLL